MGKPKAKRKDADGVPNRHIHSRISYLYQAAHYLAASHGPTTDLTASLPTNNAVDTTASSVEHHRNHTSGQSRRLLNHIGGVSRKSTIRLARGMKRTICKRCQTLLIAGSTSTESVQNASKDESKPWADVFQVRCNVCATTKRYPVEHGQRRKKETTKGEPAGHLQPEIKA